MDDTQTTTALMPVRQSALAVMASRFDMEPKVLMETLKNTVFKGATNEQLAALVIVANEHRLNPFTREIYAFPDKSGGIQAVIGVDGWIRVINGNAAFDGMQFEYAPGECTCIMHHKSRSHPVIVTEYLDECKRNTEPWTKYPRRMLRHKAMIQAGRIAFGLGSLKDEDDVVVHPASATVRATPENLFSRALPEPQPEKLRPEETHNIPPAFERPPKPAARSRAERLHAPVTAAPQAGPVELPHCKHCGEPVPDMATHQCAKMSAATMTPQDQLEVMVKEAGFSLETLIAWATERGFIEPAEAKQIGSFAAIPEVKAKFFLTNHQGLIAGLAMVDQH